jgi:hypothetical protein
MSESNGPAAAAPGDEGQPVKPFPVGAAPEQVTLNTQSQGLERTISTTQIDAETERKARLDARKQEAIDAIKLAEDEEKKQGSSNMSSIKQIWLETKRDLERIMHLYDARDGKGEMPALKRRIYDAASKVGLDLYDWEAHRMLGKAEKNSERLGVKVEKMEATLYTDDRRKQGLSILLSQDQSKAEKYANALAQSVRLADDLKIEYSTLEQELRELHQKAVEDPSTDYSDDLQDKRDELAKMDKERQGVTKDIKAMTYKIGKCDKRITVRKSLVKTITNVYNIAAELADDLQNRLEGVRVMMGDRTRVGTEIEGVVELMDGAVQTVEVLDGMEESIGNGLVKSLDAIDQRMGQYNANGSGPKGYEQNIAERNNNADQALQDKTHSMIAKYATVSFK